METLNPKQQKNARLPAVSEESEVLVRSFLRDKYNDLDGIEVVMRQKDELLRQKGLIIEQMEKELQRRGSVIGEKDLEIEFMKTSKFWKTRDIYFRLGLNRLYPMYFVHKISPKFIEYKTRLRPKRDVPSRKRGSRKFKAVYSPKVSVIVPNYNHAKFLKKRLNSIYQQTYENFEVILLDDVSTDASREILRNYAKKYSEKTRIHFNKRNSGNVFVQWKRGIKMARGELVWIAESDDYCDKDFLEKLVYHFQDEAIMLAYAHNVFVDEKGKNSTFTFEGYVGELSPTKWTRNYVETAHNEVRAGLGIKNTIPNVSGVVFRNIPAKLFDYDKLKDFRVCGDWYFYLSIIRGGKIAYAADTNNYYRFHTNNTSSNYQKKIGFVKEYAAIAKHVAGNYKVTDQLLKKNMKSVQATWDFRNPDKKTDFYKGYKLSEIKQVRERRKPNLLMGVYAFTTGGGETIPVRLANKLKQEDYAVTVYEFFQEKPENRTIRGMLDNHVPVTQADVDELTQMIKDFGIEVVHTHHTSVDVAFARLKNKNAVHVVSLHGLYEAIPSSDFKSIEEDIKNIDYWVYTADKNLGAFQGRGWFARRPKTKIINGFTPPTSQYKPTRRNLKITEDDFVVCLGSRAMRQKGWREAVDAVKLANSFSKRHITLLLVGDGPTYEELKNQELDEAIRLLGFKQNIYDYFVLSDIGVLPTNFHGESCPMTLIECISAHKPFVATNIGEIKSMLTLDNGLVAGEVLELDNGKVDVYELAHAITRFAENPDYYEFCRLNSVRCSERFSMDNVFSKYQAVYQAVLNGKNK